MGVCCSTAGKLASTSLSRHYISEISSPSLFPTESEYKQNSAVKSHIEKTFSRRENAVERASGEDLEEERSTSGFMETDVQPVWVNLCEETVKHQQKEKEESLVNVSQQRPESVAKWSEESSVENQDANKKVIASKPRCAGAKTRLKKKDSTRRPKYKDEIMLSDNIDYIVEKEIPEIPDKESALAKEFDLIVNDEIPAGESDQPKSPNPGVRPRPSVRRNRSKKSTATSVSSPGVSPPPKPTMLQGRIKKQRKKKAIEEGDEKLAQFVDFTNKNGAASQEIFHRRTKEHDKKLAENIDDTVSPSKKAQTPKKEFTKEQKDMDDKQSAKDNDCVVSLDLTHEIFFATVSYTTKAQRRKKYPTSKEDLMDDEKLAKDLEYILNDDAELNEPDANHISAPVPSEKGKECQKTLQKRDKEHR
ncbi:hypothetical protein ACROYT_G036074 [Oculina patagonica]